MDNMRDDTGLAQSERQISGYLVTALQPLPLLAGLTAAGLLALYGLGLFRVLEDIGWQMLVAAALIALLAGAAVGVLRVAKRGRGLLGYWLYSGATNVTALALALLWQGIGLVAILMAWIAPITCLTAQIPRKRLIPSLLLSGVVTITVMVLTAMPVGGRLSSNNTGGFAGLLLVVSMLALFALVVVSSQMVRYRTLQSRLVTSLVPIIAIPILFTTSVAAFNALSTNQQQLRDTLQAVSSLKRGQLDTLVQTVFTELGSVQNRSGEVTSILHVLDRQGESEEDYRLNASIAATEIRNVITLHPASDYEEVLVLDRDGNVVLATYLLDQGQNFKDQSFFQRGLSDSAAQFIKFPGQQNIAGEFKLVASAPFYGASETEILGVVVAVSSGDVVANVLGPTPGLPQAETYLVDEQFRPATRMSSPQSLVTTPAIRSLIANQAGEGSSIYFDYTGAPVLGYYVWDEVLRAAAVAQIPAGILFTRALAAVLASGIVGLLTIVIAAMAVAATSRAISAPVSDLAGAAERLATGQLTVQAQSDRQDEIGKLANAFNAMAGQLQGMIRGLEDRVAERTHDLERQTNRLRTGAEVARDAMLAPTLDELLSRAATSMMQRFGLDHAGIFLLDNQRRFAVLQAAPSQTGRQMLAENHRVRVGDAGAVGQVSATGNPVRLTRTAETAARIGDAYNTATASELAVPLRTHESLIGVIDLQSNDPGAFSPGDLEVMQVLADQLGAAIERSRLLLQVQQRLGQVEATYRAFTDQAWSAYARGSQEAVGYRYDNVRLDPVTASAGEVERLLESSAEAGRPGTGGAIHHTETLAVPIQLRGRNLGVINIHFQPGRADANTAAMIEQAADQLGTALENVRLLEDSVQRANKERRIGEITSHIGSSINMRNVLQAAVEELGRALPGSEVMVRLGTAVSPDGEEAPS
jgi:GAF domain-containing protein/HAMP domain-containing protein